MNLLGLLTRQRAKQAAQPESNFIALPLTPEETIVLTKALVAACRSETGDLADKQMLSTIRDRILRWAERQGAWWDDGQGKIILSVREKIDL